MKVEDSEEAEEMLSLNQFYSNLCRESMKQLLTPATYRGCGIVVVDVPSIDGVEVLLTSFVVTNKTRQ